jgi:hypothetical protein
MDSINERGFLSGEIKAWIDKHRGDYREWFHLSESISALGQKLMLSLNPPIDDNQKLLVSILFTRIVSHFQGVVLLIERGMVAEARSLLRGMLDATFAEVALSKNEDMVKAFIDDDFYQRLKCLNSFMALPRNIKKRHRVGNARLKKIVEGIKKKIDEDQIKPLTTEFLAQKAGMLGHYNTLFVLLSSSTHSRVMDLQQYLGEEDAVDLDDLLWGPDVKELDEILHPACELVFISARAVSNLYKGSALDTKFQEQWSVFEKLYGTS